MKNAFSAVRILLYPFALIYGMMVWLRNRLYDSGFFSSIEFDIPVINVGNLSVGGTGKTPHIEYLIRLLQHRYKIATMSRGYKRHTQGFLLANENSNALKIGDEPMQFHLKYPDIEVCVAEERITGIPQLLSNKPNVEVVLLDDAFQHRSVKAGINILITDFAKPFYTDFILPYGRLREKRNACKRADIIIVSKCPNGLTQDEANRIVEKVQPLPHQKVFFSAIDYLHSYDFFTGEKIILQQKYVVLVCCIARPEPLLSEVSTNAADVHLLSYPDHHYFLSRDLEEIKAAYDNWNVDNKIIVTTEKDAARLHLQKDVISKWDIKIAVLPIEIKILFNKAEEFEATILQYINAVLPPSADTEAIPE